MQVGNIEIYKKLQELRRRVYEKGGLVKGGVNSYANYSYFKLDDILALISPWKQELHLWDHTVLIWDLNKNLYTAITYIVDLDGGGSLEFQFDIQYDNIPKQVPQQVSGSTYSYARRYTWQMLLDLVEPDNDPDHLVGAPVKETRITSETLATIKQIGIERAGDKWSHKSPQLALWASEGRTQDLDKLTESEGKKILKSWQT